MTFFTRSPRSTQSGSIFTLLLGGIAMASVLSYGLYQILSGPLSSMVRVTNKSSAESQVRDAVNTIMADAINTFGDCDSDGAFEPRPWRVPTGPAGSFPAGGGLIPNDIGAPQTDRWGTELGYCVWDVGTRSHHVTCVGDGTHNTRRLEGSSDVITGIPGALTVVAIISAGPNRHFETTCQDYQDSATDLMYATATFAPGAGGDDIMERRTYKQLASQKPDLWALKVGSTTIAVIDKILEIGTLGAAQVVITPSTGLITTTGRVDATGGIRPGNAIANGACTAGTPGLLRYSTTLGYIEACNGTSFLGPSIDSMSDGKTDYTKFNVFLGKSTGAATAAGERNTALGYEAFISSAASTDNTAIGFQALRNNDGASTNTAVGGGALLSNTDGFDNVAVGINTLTSNENGSYNIAIGLNALMGNVDGSDNVALGLSALQNNQSGARNVAIGQESLINNTTGTLNIAIGYVSGPFTDGLDLTTAIGWETYAAASKTWVIGKINTKQAIYESSNPDAAMGVATLCCGGEIRVDSTLVTQYSRIFTTINDPNGGTPGAIYIKSVTPGSDFTLASTSTTDTSIVAWEIKEPNCLNDLPAPDGVCN